MTTVEQIAYWPAARRFHTRTPWLDSYHSFSFGSHHDPSNLGHGLLVVSNDDTVAPRSGFEWHPHENMEIVTWVLSGELEHEDSTGRKGVVSPGVAQRMSAGRGIFHAERNRSDHVPVHFIQMWVKPDARDTAPEYEQRELAQLLARGGLFPLASGRGHDGALKLRQKEAVLHVGRLSPGERVVVPQARFVHVYLASGTASSELTRVIEAGDALRLQDAPPLELRAGSDGAEVLVWEMGQ